MSAFRLASPPSLPSDVLLGTNTDRGTIARCIKLIHTLPPVPIPHTVFFFTGFNNSNDHFLEEGAEGVDEFRRRGSPSFTSHFSACLSLLPALPSIIPVYSYVNLQFLTTFTLSLMKSIDIRSEAAVNLLAEFLDMDAGHNTQGNGGRKNAEHFAHGEFIFFLFFKV